MAFFRGLLVAFLVAAAHVSANDEVASGESVPATSPAIFAIPDVWPWGFQDDKGELQGSLITLMDRLSELSGVPVSAQLLPLRRVILDLLRGRAEFAFLFQSPDLDENAFPVDTILQLNLMLMAMRDTDFPLTLDGLAGKRVGYVRGTYLGESFKADEAVMKVPVYNIRQAIEMLMLGRISAVLASDHNIAMTIDAYGFPAEEFRLQEHVKGQKARLYMSPDSGNPEHARLLKEALQHMRDNGELQRIFQTSSAQ
ncbi:MULTISPECIES: substrate-binding periplasmic protein [unclassified Marinobacter]|uniref:substrate-binding periplasmic protein n=1 Tax=unclassified Marinobacter TaxID=83889 RepID=UPI001268219E|nr:MULTISPECIES: transporter substrate-binding domain-containing protein [unclassified Marinobacter]QFS87689.1 Bacterial extracellular solute-binding protein, family 3 [Marinobacter sp. THAF197a]QFT51474.1 Bacterial extracellular solute-binding protein, family 3 [Marinobacter sp. THAF39]